MALLAAYAAMTCLCRAGIDLATVEVRMDKLKVEADIAVGSRGNPSVTNTMRNLAEVRGHVVITTSVIRRTISHM